MGTYDHNQVLKDYAAGKITAEMAVGHILQHIEKLYAAQHAAEAHRYKLQDRLTKLEQAIRSQPNSAHSP